MKMTMNPLCCVLVAGAICVAPVALAADPVIVQSEVRHTDVLSASRGESQAQARLAGDFGAFAGSQENAQNLFTGLRNGTPITLNSASPANGGVVGTTQLTFSPPTRPMGYGNAYISLALAKQQLASYGITNPTPEQIQAALTGGTIATGGASPTSVELKGVLTQRADGMGWGQIAKAAGMNLGHVVSDLRSQNARLVTGVGAGTNAGITTATGAAVQSGTSVNGSALGAQRGHSSAAPGQSRGSGIVSATGGALGGGVNANANAQAGIRAGGMGAGIVTGGSIQGAASGMLSGAASGAMLGSVVPGIGTAVGAVGGALLGGAGGYFGG